MSGSSTQIDKIAEILRTDNPERADCAAAQQLLVGLERQLFDEGRPDLAATVAAVTAHASAGTDLCHAADALNRIDPESPPPEREAIDRDQETLEVFAEFFLDADDGLATVDDLLLAIDRSGPDPESVNSLFRVFHSIKGVAGFLDAVQIGALAHATESVLDAGRAGNLEWTPQLLDGLFGATAQLRTLLQEIKAAVAASRAIAAVPGIAGAIADLARKRHGEPDEPAAPTVATPSPAAPSPAAPAPTAGTTRVRASVKVDLDRVDRLVEMIGELAIAESMVANAPEVLESDSPRFLKHISHLSKLCRSLQHAALEMRMVPVRGAFQRTARMARDVARICGKDVVLEYTGETTEVDRSVIERIEDPLVHLVRNAVDHGIESPGERSATDKPPRAVISLSAKHRGGSIVIEFRDDGRGLDTDAIIARSRQRGLLAADAHVSDADAGNLIFEPGFSTAASVSDLSGRGVGLDVVKRSIEAVRGRVSVSSVPGKGTTFTLVLPLTLAIIDGTLVRCGTERYIVPTLSMIESFRAKPDMFLRYAGRQELVDVRETAVPVLRMRDALRVDSDGSEHHDLVVLVESAGRRVALVVDDIIAQQQVVIKRLDVALKGNKRFAGGAILADGAVGLILNVDELCRSVHADATHHGGIT